MNALLLKTRQYGLRIIPRIFKSVLRRVGFVFETFYLMRTEVVKEEVEKQMQAYSYDDVHEITIHEIDLFTGVDAAKLERFRSRFASGLYSCYGIIQDNQIVYFTWISWKKMNFPVLFNMQKDLEDDAAFLEDSYCLPSFRGRSYHKKMNLYRLLNLAEQHKKYALALVLKENQPALKVQYKSGLSIHKKYTCLRFMNKTRIIEKTIN